MLSFLLPFQEILFANSNNSDMNYVRFWMLFSYVTGYKAATIRRAHVVFNVAFG